MNSPLTASGGSRTLYQAIAKSVTGRYAVYVANFVSLMLLARLFTPEQFGVLGLLTVFSAFFNLLSEAGLGPALINTDSLDARSRNGLFGLTIVVGLLSSLLFSLSSHLFVVFYAEPRVATIAPLVGLAILFHTWSVLPIAFLNREQAFIGTAKASLAGELIGTVLCALATLVVDPLQALAIKGVANSAVVFGVTWYLSRWTEFERPMPGRHFAAIRPLLRFSMYQFGFNFINYFSRNLDNILIGRYFGPSTLGAYDKAYSLMRYPLMLLTFAMTPAIQPVIRKAAGDPKLVEEIHRGFTFRLSIAGLLVAVLIFVFSELIVRIALGEQWLVVGQYIRVLAIAIPVQVVLSTSGSFFQAMNRSDLLFLSGFLSAVVMVSAIIAGIASHDLSSLCWWLVLAFHVNFLQAYLILHRWVFRLPVTGFFKSMVPAASGVLLLSGYATL